VGGLDPSGGAGILADLRAARAAGGEALAVLGALTAQSSGRVAAVRAVPRGWVREQLVALAAEVRFGAVKTGLIASPASVAELGAWLRRSKRGPLVVDPVFESGTGVRLVPAEARRAAIRELLPLAALVTPNRMEAELLSGVTISGPGDMERAARALGQLGPAAVLIKGGHLDGLPSDLLWDGRGARWFRSRERIAGRWHGLGCHLASAIAARLALGDPLARAVARARAVLRRGMRGAVVTPSGRLVPSWDARGRRGR
jgi:hydroxymethylpyrimidine/phosphomethylpyrimidine kinase